MESIVNFLCNNYNLMDFMQNHFLSVGCVRTFVDNGLYEYTGWIYYAVI